MSASRLISWNLIGHIFKLVHDLCDPAIPFSRSMTSLTWPDVSSDLLIV